MRRVLGHGMQTDIDSDALVTQPMSKLAVLRAAAREAVEARDAIDDLSSPEWRAAQAEALVACHHANAELLRQPKTLATLEVH